MFMAVSSCTSARGPEDRKMTTINLIADMIEYRNVEIAQISQEIRQGIWLLHRELITENRVRQANTLSALTDRLAQLIADNEYDTGSLQVFLEHDDRKKTSAEQHLAEGGIGDLHYFQ